MELLALLVNELPKLKPKDGREFFKGKYGVVDGHEVDRIAEDRKWRTTEPSDNSIHAGKQIFFLVLTT
jgi:hypothetical protein